MYALNTIQIVTAVALSIFIVFRLKAPASVLRGVAGLSGKAVLGIIVIYLFYEHFILGLLGVIAVYELMRQVPPSEATLPIEESNSPASDDSMMLSSFQQFPPTLEETIVNSAVPLIQNQSPPHLHFKSFPEDTHDAALVA